MVVSPTPSATWCPSVAASASAGVVATAAAASFAVAVTVVESTALSTLAVYASVSATKPGERVTPLSDSALSVASVDALPSTRNTPGQAVEGAGDVVR